MSKLFKGQSYNGPKKNVFDLSHEKKLSMNMGKIVPFYLQEIVPGDKFKVSSEQLIRLAPMIAPMMHRVNVFTHYFFVPNRLVFDKWQDFITGGTDGKQAPSFPTIPVNAGNYMFFDKNHLPDYFGIPPVEPGSLTIPAPEFNALPFRAYHLIYNEYFRDQTLIAPIEFSIGETVPAEDYPVLTQLRDRCWEKDYFTTAMPWAQRGDEVLIPTVGAPFAGSYPPTKAVFADTETQAGQGYFDAEAMTTRRTGSDAILAGNNQVNIDVHLTDASQATSASGSINDLRKAVRLQEWLEKNARAGARYVEQIMAHFGVRSSDARLQRPEFLGGGINPVVVSEVLSTVQTTDLPQGNMSGHGISVGHDNAFTKTFEEHGYIIGVMSVLPRTGYQQGVPRAFLKKDKFDFFWPEFANIGEQPVYTQELYQDYTSVENEEIFGYQSRYAEYKFAPNQVHGDFRESMAYWQMCRIFSGKPALNEFFVKSDPTHRVFAVTDPNEHKLYVQIFNKVTAIRPMPQFGTPQL
ncbi:MAG: major capsid protein [Microviridae sp.]|nr:MAG: major capsid protein [Microviridae sp.]